MRIENAIYLDHQATTPVAADVLAEMTPYFSELFGNPHSSDHWFGWQAAEAVEKAAVRVARLIGADPDEIVFTSGATEANNLALLGLGRRAAGGKRRRILVSAIEHKCVLTAGRILHEQFGYSVEYLPVDHQGFVDLAALDEALSDDVLIVSIMAVNNEIGTIQNLSEISRLIKKSGSVFHCDGAQAPCAIDLSDIVEDVDLLSLSAHKMYGPKGIGALFIRRDLQAHIEPLIYGGGQQRDLRSGTVAVPLCVGMGAAAAHLSSSIAQQERERVQNLRDRFVEQMMNLRWPLSVNGPQGEHRHPGNANVCFSGFDAHDILGALQPYLAASTGSACTSGTPELSHVLKAIGLSGDEAEASIRFSLGRGTTDQDIDDAVSLIDNALARLASAGSGLRF